MQRCIFVAFPEILTGAFGYRMERAIKAPIHAS
jgi:hypothetical protein